jgi:hypothetical protein
LISRQSRAFSWADEDQATSRGDDHGVSRVEHTLVLDMAALNQDRRLIPGTEMIGRWQATSPLRSRTMTITYDGNLTDLEKATLHITFWARAWNGVRPCALRQPAHVSGVFAFGSCVR